MHNVYARAYRRRTRRYIFLFLFRVAACLHGNSIDTSHAAAAVLIEINCVLDGAASDIRCEAVHIAIEIIIFD